MSKRQRANQESPYSLTWSIIFTGKYRNPSTGEIEEVRNRTLERMNKSQLQELLRTNKNPFSEWFNLNEDFIPESLEQHQESICNGRKETIPIKEPRRYLVRLMRIHNYNKKDLAVDGNEFHRGFMPTPRQKGTPYYHNTLFSYPLSIEEGWIQEK